MELLEHIQTLFAKGKDTPCTHLYPTLSTIFFPDVQAAQSIGIKVSLHLSHQRCKL